uniref:Endonuclease/exonuclease/phosphatase domain-containing protein n=1 Tax=Oncorhynchus tshawytscha TaxID=74940 RepID=A0A8C8JM19_ONCTS
MLDVQITSTNLYPRTFTWYRVLTIHLKATDINRLQNIFYKVIASSSAPNKTEVIKRNLNMKVGVSGGDIDEQYCFSSVTINCTTLCLSAIYAPNAFDKSFFEDLKVKLLDFPDSVTVLGGDFNLTLDPTINIITRICIFLIPFRRKHFVVCGNVKLM